MSVDRPLVEGSMGFFSRSWELCNALAIFRQSMHSRQPEAGDLDDREASRNLLEGQSYQVSGHQRHVQ